MELNSDCGAVHSVCRKQDCHKDNEPFGLRSPSNHAHLNQASYSKHSIRLSNWFGGVPVLTTQELFKRSGSNKTFELWKLGRGGWRLVTYEIHGTYSYRVCLVGGSARALRSVILKWIIMSEGSRKAKRRFLSRSVTCTKYFQCICVKAGQLMRGWQRRL